MEKELPIVIQVNESMAEILLSALSSHIYALRVKMDFAHVCNQKGEFEVIREAYGRAETARAEILDMISANFDRA